MLFSTLVSLSGSKLTFFHPLPRLKKEREEEVMKAEADVGSTREKLRRQAPALFCQEDYMFAENIAEESTFSLRPSHSAAQNAPEASHHT